MYRLSLLLLPLPALAAPLSENVTTFKSWFITCLVVLLVGGLVFLFSKKNLRASLRSGGKIQVQSVLSLGIKEKLVLVEVEEQRFLLGVTQQQITLISELTRGGAGVPPAAFAQVLEKMESSGTQAEEVK